MAAELDTFLYARGNKPWKNQTPGTLSPSGVFNGYEFDTTGTRLQKADPTIPLALIGRYRHVVWLVDGKGGTFRRSPLDLNQPQTSLYYMGTQGHVNTIGAYIAQGGQLWVAGGGIAMASQLPTNSGSNDRPTITFSATAGESDPRPLHVRVPDVALRGAHRLGAGRRVALPRPAGGHGLDLRNAAAGARDEDADVGSCSSDTRRDGATTSSTWRTPTSEFLQKPNNILEDDGTDPQQPHLVSVMDTLYHVDGASLPTDIENPYNVVMTYYHGRAHSSVVCCGFNLWTFKHDQLVPLVDLVLGRLWGLAEVADDDGARAAARLERRDSVAADAAGRLPRRASTPIRRTR